MVAVGFNPRNRSGIHALRRVATIEYLQSSLRDGMRLLDDIFRGLKPTATIMASLRDEWQLSTDRTNPTDLAPPYLLFINRSNVSPMYARCSSVMPG